MNRILKLLIDLRDDVKYKKDYEIQALADDDPKSTCAANHRGAIKAYDIVLDRLDNLIKKTQP